MLLLLLLIAVCVKSVAPSEDDALGASLRTFGVYYLLGNTHAAGVYVGVNIQLGQ